MEAFCAVWARQGAWKSTRAHARCRPPQADLVQETTKHRVRGAGSLETVDKALGTDE